MRGGTPRFRLARWLLPRVRACYPRTDAARAPVLELLPPDLAALPPVACGENVMRVFCSGAQTLPVLFPCRAVSVCLVLHTLPVPQALTLLRQCAATGLPCVVLDACMAERTISVPCAAAVGALLRVGSGGHFAAYMRAGAVEGLLYRAGLIPYTRHILCGGGLTLALCRGGTMPPA